MNPVLGLVRTIPPDGANLEVDMDAGSARARRDLRGAVTRPLFAAMGLAFVGLGTLGLFLPVLPSTIFFICALWAFRRSSKRLEDWLFRLPHVGPALRDWDETGSLSVRAKIWAVSAIAIAVGISCWLSPRLAVWIALPLVGAGVIVYLLTRPTKSRSPRAPAPAAE